MDIFETVSGQIVARDIDDSQFDAESNIVTMYFFDGHKWDVPDFLNGLLVSDMPEFAIVSGGHLWISTWDGLVASDGQEWQLYDPDEPIEWLVQTPDDRLWSESWRQNGIVSFDGQKWNLELNTDNSLLDGAKTNTALATSTGQILLATDRGLFQYDPDLNQLSLTLGQDSINFMLEANDGIIWVVARDQTDSWSVI